MPKTGSRIPKDVAERNFNISSQFAAAARPRKREMIKLKAKANFRTRRLSKLTGSPIKPSGRVVSQGTFERIAKEKFVSKNKAAKTVTARPSPILTPRDFIKIWL